MTDLPNLQRPDFFDGQRLTADDLTVIQTYHQEMRWLHNRSLHNWGIVFGFAASGKRDGRFVTVEPGFALDKDGRELILTETVTMTVPAVAGDDAGKPKEYYLTASYDDDPEKITRAGVCDTAGAVRYQEEPVIAWKDPTSSAYRHGYDVILASVQIQACKLARDVSAGARRDALPPTQPYVASGLARGDALNWDLFPSAGQGLGIKAVINTNSGSFRNTPQYTAHIMGNRIVTLTGDDDDDNEAETLVLDGFTHVANPTALNFEIRLLLPSLEPLRVNRFHVINIQNLVKVVDAVRDDISGSGNFEPSIQTLVRNGLRLEVGQTLTILRMSFPTGMVTATVNRSHFEPLLDDLMSQYGISRSELLENNDLTMDTLNFSLGDRLRIPTGSDLALNPASMWNDDELLTKINGLNWSVVWMGVES